MGCGASMGTSVSDLPAPIRRTTEESPKNAPDRLQQRKIPSGTESSGDGPTAPVLQDSLGETVLNLADGERPPLPELSEIDATKLVLIYRLSPRRPSGIVKPTTAPLN